MNANELADKLEGTAKFINNISNQYHAVREVKEAATMLRQQQAEIEALKNANRFIQNFAQEQHQRTVALEMRELTDEEINDIAQQCWVYPQGEQAIFNQHKFAKAILRKAQEK